MNTIVNNSLEFAKGQRGSPVERTIWKLHDANIFNQTKVETLTSSWKIRIVPKRLQNQSKMYPKSMPKIRSENIEK